LASGPPESILRASGVVLRKNLIGITPKFFQARIHDVVRREQASLLARNPLRFSESPAGSLAAPPEDREFPVHRSDAAALGCSGPSILWRNPARVAHSRKWTTPNGAAADCRSAVRSRPLPSQPQPECSTLKRPGFSRLGPVPPQRFQTGHAPIIDKRDRLESLPSVAATSTP
jgi:hypothetical protein